MLDIDYLFVYIIIISLLYVENNLGDSRRVVSRSTSINLMSFVFVLTHDRWTGWIIAFVE